VSITNQKFNSVSDLESSNNLERTFKRGPFLLFKSRAPINQQTRSETILVPRITIFVHRETRKIPKKILELSITIL
jgi:hypothetical protein